MSHNSHHDPISDIELSHEAELYDQSSPLAESGPPTKGRQSSAQGASQGSPEILPHPKTRKATDDMLFDHLQSSHIHGNGVSPGDGAAVGHANHVHTDNTPTPVDTSIMTGRNGGGNGRRTSPVNGSSSTQPTQQPPMQQTSILPQLVSNVVPSSPILVLNLPTNGKQTSRQNRRPAIEKKNEPFGKAPHGVEQDDMGYSIAPSGHLQFNVQYTYHQAQSLLYTYDDNGHAVLVPSPSPSSFGGNLPQSFFTSCMFNHETPLNRLLSLLPFALMRDGSKHKEHHQQGSSSLYKFHGIPHTSTCTLRLRYVSNDICPQGYATSLSPQTRVDPKFIRIYKKPRGSKSRPPPAMNADINEHYGGNLSSISTSAVAPEPAPIFKPFQYHELVEVQPTFTYTPLDYTWTSNQNDMIFKHRYLTPNDLEHDMERLLNLRQDVRGQHDVSGITNDIFSLQEIGHFRPFAQHMDRNRFGILRFHLDMTTKRGTAPDAVDLHPTSAVNQIFYMTDRLLFNYFELIQQYHLYHSQYSFYIYTQCILPSLYTQYSQRIQQFYAPFHEINGSSPPVHSPITSSPSSPFSSDNDDQEHDHKQEQQQQQASPDQHNTWDTPCYLQPDRRVEPPTPPPPVDLLSLFGNRQRLEHEDYQHRKTPPQEVATMRQGHAFSCLSTPSDLFTQLDKFHTEQDDEFISTMLGTIDMNLEDATCVDTILSMMTNTQQQHFQKPADKKENDSQQQQGEEQQHHIEHGPLTMEQEYSTLSSPLTSWSITSLSASDQRALRPMKYNTPTYLYHIIPLPQPPPLSLVARVGVPLYLYSRFGSRRLPLPIRQIQDDKSFITKIKSAYTKRKEAEAQRLQRTALYSDPMARTFGLPPFVSSTTRPRQTRTSQLASLAGLQLGYTSAGVLGGGATHLPQQGLQQQQQQRGVPPTGSGIPHQIDESIVIDDSSSGDVGDMPIPHYSSQPLPPLPRMPPPPHTSTTMARPRTTMIQSDDDDDGDDDDHHQDLSQQPDSDPPQHPEGSDDHDNPQTSPRPVQIGLTRSQPLFNRRQPLFRSNHAFGARPTSSLASLVVPPSSHGDTAKSKTFSPYKHLRESMNNLPAVAARTPQKQHQPSPARRATPTATATVASMQGPIDTDFDFLPASPVAPPVAAAVPAARQTPMRTPTRRRAAAAAAAPHKGEEENPPGGAVTPSPASKRTRKPSSRPTETVFVQLQEEENMSDHDEQVSTTAHTSPERSVKKSPAANKRSRATSNDAAPTPSKQGQSTPRSTKTREPRGPLPPPPAFPDDMFLNDHHSKSGSGDVPSDSEIRRMNAFPQYTRTQHSPSQSQPTLFRIDSDSSSDSMLSSTGTSSSSHSSSTQRGEFANLRVGSFRMESSSLYRTVTASRSVSISSSSSSTATTTTSISPPPPPSTDERVASLDTGIPMVGHEPSLSSQPFSPPSFAISIPVHRYFPNTDITNAERLYKSCKAAKIACHSLHVSIQKYYKQQAAIHDLEQKRNEIIQQMNALPAEEGCPPALCRAISTLSKRVKSISTAISELELKLESLTKTAAQQLAMIPVKPVKSSKGGNAHIEKHRMLSTAVSPMPTIHDMVPLTQTDLISIISTAQSMKPCAGLTDSVTELLVVLPPNLRTTYIHEYVTALRQLDQPISFTYHPTPHNAILGIRIAPPLMFLLQTLALPSITNTAPMSSPTSSSSSPSDESIADHQSKRARHTSNNSSTQLPPPTYAGYLPLELLSGHTKATSDAGHLADQIPNHPILATPPRHMCVCHFIQMYISTLQEQGVFPITQDQSSQQQLINGISQRLRVLLHYLYRFNAKTTANHVPPCEDLVDHHCTPDPPHQRLNAMGSTPDWQGTASSIPDKICICQLRSSLFSLAPSVIVPIHQSDYEYQASLPTDDAEGHVITAVTSRNENSRVGYNHVDDSHPGVDNSSTSKGPHKPILKQLRTQPHGNSNLSSSLPSSSSSTTTTTPSHLSTHSINDTLQGLITAIGSAYAPTSVLMMIISATPQRLNNSQHWEKGYPAQENKPRLVCLCRACQLGLQYSLSSSSSSSSPSPPRCLFQTAYKSSSTTPMFLSIVFAMARSFYHSQDTYMSNQRRTKTTIFTQKHEQHKGVFLSMLMQVNGIDETTAGGIVSMLHTPRKLFALCCDGYHHEYNIPHLLYDLYSRVYHDHQERFPDDNIFTQQCKEHLGILESQMVFIPATEMLQWKSPSGKEYYSCEKCQSVSYVKVFRNMDKIITSLSQAASGETVHSSNSNSTPQVNDSSAPASNMTTFVKRFYKNFPQFIPPNRHIESIIPPGTLITTRGTSSMADHPISGPNRLGDSLPTCECIALNCALRVISNVRRMTPSQQRVGPLLAYRLIQLMMSIAHPLLSNK